MRILYRARKESLENARRPDCEGPSTNFWTGSKSQEGSRRSVRTSERDPARGRPDGRVRGDNAGCQSPPITRPRSRHSGRPPGSPSCSGPSSWPSCFRAASSGSLSEAAWINHTSLREPGSCGLVSASPNPPAQLSTARNCGDRGWERQGRPPKGRVRGHFLPHLVPNCSGTAVPRGS